MILDINADGILNVLAMEKLTSTENKMTIMDEPELFFQADISRKVSEVK